MAFAQTTGKPGLVHCTCNGPRTSLQQCRSRVIQRHHATCSSTRVATSPNIRRTTATSVAASSHSSAAGTPDQRGSRISSTGASGAKLSDCVTAGIPVPSARVQAETEELIAKILKLAVTDMDLARQVLADQLAQRRPTQLQQEGFLGSRSGAVAEEVLEPLFESPSMPPLYQVRRFLADHSDVRIPIIEGAYAELAPRLEKAVRAKLKVVPSCLLAAYFSTVLGVNVCNLNSEQSTTVTIGYLLSQTYQQLQRYVGGNVQMGLEFVGNCAEQGSIMQLGGIGMPDVVGTVDGLTLYVGEDRPRLGLMEAKQDMADYMKHGLEEGHYGDLEYIVGHIVADPLLCFIAVSREGRVIEVSPRFKLNDPNDRIDAVCTLLRVFALLTAMRLHLDPMVLHTLPLFRPIVHGQTMVMLTGAGVTKVISRYQDFADSHRTGKQQMVAAYAVADKAARDMESQGRQPFMISADTAPQFLEKSSGEVTYIVTTTPVGTHGRPRTEEDLRRLAWACLNAASVLHAAGLVHHDFRKENVVRLGRQGWLVLDLEHCSWDGVRLPPGYTQDSWTTSTTTPGHGCIIYNKDSDIMQIGVLLERVCPVACSKLARDFIEQLISKQLTVEAALQHDWLKGLGHDPTMV